MSKGCELMKIAAYFALVTGLAAAIAIVILKAKAVKKAGKATRQDIMVFVFLPLFALLLIANLVLVTMYF